MGKKKGKLSKREKELRFYEELCESMDENFSFIMDFTGGGAPFGVSWESVGINSYLPFDHKALLYLAQQDIYFPILASELDWESILSMKPFPGVDLSRIDTEKLKKGDLEGFYKQLEEMEMDFRNLGMPEDLEEEDWDEYLEEEDWDEDLEEEYLEEEDWDEDLEEEYWEEEDLGEQEQRQEPPKKGSQEKGEAQTKSKQKKGSEKG